MVVVRLVKIEYFCYFPLFSLGHYNTQTRQHIQQYREVYYLDYTDRIPDTLNFERPYDSQSNLLPVTFHSA